MPFRCIAELDPRPVQPTNESLQQLVVELRQGVCPLQGRRDSEDVLSANELLHPPDHNYGPLVFCAGVFAHEDVVKTATVRDSDDPVDPAQLEAWLLLQDLCKHVGQEGSPVDAGVSGTRLCRQGGSTDPCGS